MTSEVSKVESAIKKLLAWVAVEFKFIKELKADLEDLQTVVGNFSVNKNTISKDFRHIKTELRKSGRSTRVINRTYEELEEDISKLIEKVPQNIKDEFKGFEEHMEVAIRTIVEKASMYKGSLKDDIDSLKHQIEAVENEPNDTNIRAIQAHIKSIEKQIDYLLKFILALEIDLKKTMKRTEQFERHIFSKTKRSVSVYFNLIRIAKAFELKFKKKFMDIFFIDKLDYHLVQFITGVPGYENVVGDIINYDRSNADDRIKVLSEFERRITSNEHINIFESTGAAARNIRSFQKQQPLLSFIPDTKLRRKVTKLYEKIFAFCRGRTSFLMFPKPGSLLERSMTYGSHLWLHEACHVLLIENNLRPKDNKYNEGVVTYFEAFCRGSEEKIPENINKLKSEIGNPDYYYTFAIKVHELMKSKSSNERRKVLESLS